MCGITQDGCYSGIAAEIDTKNMPLAYFLNVSTPACFLNVSTLSALSALGLPDAVRGERLSPEEFIKLSKLL